MKKFTNAERVTLTTIEEVQNFLWSFTVFACFCWGLRRRRILAICFVMAVGSELLWNQTKIASKCPDTNLQRPLQCYNWKNRKSTQQIPELLDDGFVVRLAPLSCGAGDLKVGRVTIGVWLRENDFSAFVVVNVCGDESGFDGRRVWWWISKMKRRVCWWMGWWRWAIVEAV